MIFEKRVSFSSVRERGLFFSPVREEVIIFKRNISDLQTRKVKKGKERKGEIMSIVMLESNEESLSTHKYFPITNRNCIEPRW